MRIARLQDNRVNKWSMHNLEAIKDEVDITLFVGESNAYDTSNINLRIKRLTHRQEIINGLLHLGDVKRRHRRNSFPTCDFYFHSLKKGLCGYDIVHCNDFMRSSYTAAELKHELGYKLVLNWWENIPYCNIFSDKTTFLKENTIDQVDHFLPCSQSVKKTLILEGIEPDKITVVYPGVDVGKFKRGEKDVEFARSLGISTDRFIVLYMGQLVSWKGVHNLVYAAKNLKTKNKDICFVIGGKGAQKESIKKLVSHANLENFFRFLAFVSYDTIEKVYQLADVLVLPSIPKMTWQEQFGMVLVEAMACGVPVVASNTGSIPEVVGDAGLLFTPGNFWELADRLAALHDNNGLLAELSEKSRQRAAAKFDARKNAQELLEVYHRVCN